MPEHLIKLQICVFWCPAIDPYIATKQVEERASGEQEQIIWGDHETSLRSAAISSSVSPPGQCPKVALIPDVGPCDREPMSKQCKRSWAQSPLAKGVTVAWTSLGAKFVPPLLLRPRPPGKPD